MWVYIQDIADVLKNFSSEVQILNFQLIVKHDTQKDRAVIRVVPAIMPLNSERLSVKIIEHLYQQRIMLQELLENNIIHPLSLEWCEADELECNKRTGKTKKILCKRMP